MKENRIEIEFENSDSPEEIAAARQEWEQFGRNSAWLQSHILEIGDNFRGKCICIAGEQLFAADTVEEAVSQATAAHPEDRGWFAQYIPKERVTRIYLAATFWTFLPSSSTALRIVWSCSTETTATRSSVVRDGEPPRAWTIAKAETALTPGPSPEYGRGELARSGRRPTIRGKKN